MGVSDKWGEEMRSIDADALIAWIKGSQQMTSKMKCVIAKIETMPDAVSVVHGEWKPFDLTWGRSIWYCTACEEGVEVPCDIWTHKPIYNFCPNCGAKMKGADDE